MSEHGDDREEFDFMRKMADDITNYHERINSEFERLSQDVPVSVKVGDTVLVAAGLIGRGHVWVRKECTVLAVTGGGIKVNHNGGEYDTWTEWISPTLIVGVINS